MIFSLDFTIVDSLNLVKALVHDFHVGIHDRIPEASELRDVLIPHNLPVCALVDMVILEEG